MPTTEASTATSLPNPIGQTKDQKRARTGEQLEGGSPNKRKKGEPSKKKWKLPRPPKVNAVLKAALKAKAKEALLTQPKWKILSSPPASGTWDGSEDRPLTSLRPRIWTGDKAELLGILPELSGQKCVNGISWQRYENPMLILDDTTTFFDVKQVDNLAFDLITTRLFTCPRASLHRTELDKSLSSMTVLTASTEDFKQALPRASGEESVPLDVSSTFQFGTSYQATALAKPGVPCEVHPPLGISQDVDLTWLPMAADTTPERQLTKASHFPPRMSADIPFNFQNVDPEFFCKPRSLHVVVRKLAKIILAGHRAEAMASIDKLDSFLVRDLVPHLASKLEIASIPDRSCLPPGAQPEFEFLLNAVQKRKAIAQEAPIADKQVRLPQLVDDPHYRHDLYPPTPLGPLPYLTHTIYDRQATTAANMNRIVVSPTPSISAGYSHLHNSEAHQTHFPRDTPASLVPKPIPEELQALIDAYVFGKPLTVISSHQRLRDHWLLHLPTEYGYVVMGFFRIIGIEETRVLPSQPTPTSKTSRDFISGQVRWRFRLLWSPGGEEGVWPNRTEELNYPWWSLPMSKQENENATPVSKSDEDDKELPPDPEDSFPTTEQYRELRKQNPEFQWRFRPMQELYYYLFPPHLLMPFTAQMSDANFPRGWICSTCGRMNFQKAMRHRKCSGSQCKNSKPVSYYLDLFLLRAPQDRLTLSLPYNIYPHAVTVKRIIWEDGTQTFTCFMPNAEKPTGYIKHIFTGNLPHLQDRANGWLQKVQLELEIVRKPGDNGPYFYYSASCSKEDLSKWRNVPDCVNEIKDDLLHRTKCFGEIEKEKFRIQKLNISAWVTSGSKKQTQPIHAKKNPVALFCLGCNIILNIVPQSMKTMPTVPQVEEKEETQGHSGWIAQGLHDETTADFTPTQDATSSKKEPNSFTFSLVHGDVLVLFGDSFEYVIKRSGTAFLLIGSSLDDK